MFEKMSLDEQLKMMQVNMQSLTSLSHYFIPELKKNSPSYILNTASTSAFQAIPAMSLYAACKAFVIMFSRGLKMELQQENISVSCLIPGTTETNFMDRAGMNDAIRKLAKKFEMPADVVAKKAVEGMFNKQLEIIPGFENKISAIGTKFLPKAVVEKIAANIYLKNLNK
jgi:short-subunit dehydrogenase